MAVTGPLWAVLVEEDGLLEAAEAAEAAAAAQADAEAADTATKDSEEPIPPAAPTAPGPSSAVDNVPAPERVILDAALATLA